MPNSLYTDTNKQNRQSEFTGWALQTEALQGANVGESLTALTPQRNQVITVYPCFNQYPVLTVLIPDSIAYNNEDGLWETLIRTRSLSAISGTYLEEWLLSFVTEASDREDGTYGPGAHLYLSGFESDWTAATDQPTYMSLVYTCVDNHNHIVTREVTWYIGSDGLVDILVR